MTLLQIVRLDSIHCPNPSLAGLAHTYTEYPTTQPEEVAERIRGADVVITTRALLTAETLRGPAAASLRLVAILAVGSDNVDLAACAQRGILVCNVPAASNESVAEHAIALYFGLRRNLIQMHQTLADTDEWFEKGSLTSYFPGLPTTCKNEVMAIVGAGDLGLRIAKIAQALNMTVILADRKGVPAADVRAGRTEFEAAISRSTIIMITSPLAPSTMDMFTSQEFGRMRRDAVVVNVARGGIVVEADLVAALRARTIAAAATDVFVEEPATRRSNVLMQAAAAFKEDPVLHGTLLLTPHVAWWATSSVEKLRSTVSANITAWARGEPQNLVVE